MSELKCELCPQPTVLRNNKFCKLHSCDILYCGQQKMNGYPYCKDCICNRNGCPNMKRSQDKYCMTDGTMDYIVGLDLRKVGVYLRKKFEKDTFYCGGYSCLTTNLVSNDLPTKY